MGAQEKTWVPGFPVFQTYIDIRRNMHNYCVYVSGYDCFVRKITAYLHCFDTAAFDWASGKASGCKNHLDIFL